MLFNSTNNIRILQDKTERKGRDGTLLPMLELKGAWDDYKLALAPAKDDPEALKILEEKPENKARRRSLRDLVKNYGRTRRGTDLMRRKREAEKAAGGPGYRAKKQAKDGGAQAEADKLGAEIALPAAQNNREVSYCTLPDKSRRIMAFKRLNFHFKNLFDSLFSGFKSPDSKRKHTTNIGTSLPNKSRNLATALVQLVTRLPQWAVLALLPRKFKANLYSVHTKSTYKKARKFK